MKPKTNIKRDILKELLEHRDANIKEAHSWSIWDIEDQLRRAKIAKEAFIFENPRHDLSIINEHISQLDESYKSKLRQESENY